MNQQCKVCEEPAAGFHFGAFTCEGCKSFFGRAHTNPTAAAATECKTGGGRCVIDKKNRTSCKACRLKKCLAVGMSKSGSRYGRRSNWFKIHCLIQQQQQQHHQQQQLQRQQKRRIPRGGDGDREEKDSGVSSLSPLPPLLPPPPPLMLPLPVPVVPMPLFFGFAPKYWAPLPRSKHSAFRETVCSRSDDDDNAVNDNDDDDDRPIDLTVRGRLCVDGDDDDDDDDEGDNNNNETAVKYARKLRSPTRSRDRKDAGAGTPLDLTRANRNFGGIRS